MKRAAHLLTVLVVFVLLPACARTGPVDTPTATMAQAPTFPPQAVGTATPASVQTPTATLKPTATPTPTVVPTVTPSPAAKEPTPTPGKAEIHAVVGISVDDALNVREGPGPDQPLVATIPPIGRGIQVTGDGEPVGDALWVPVRYEELEGWANSHYLARQVGSTSDEVVGRAAECILALREEDWETVARMAHPVKGVRFSPYGYIRPGWPGEGDLVFGPGELVKLPDDQTVYRWGVYDGTGEPIDLTFQDYYQRFIYGADFAHPDAVGFNEVVGRGNTLVNIADVYPEGEFVEYHFEGFDPQLEGLDWRSLRLVFEERGGTWYLVGIVHDEWTI